MKSSRPSSGKRTSRRSRASALPRTPTSSTPRIRCRRSSTATRPSPPPTSKRRASTPSPPAASSASGVSARPAFSCLSDGRSRIQVYVRQDALSERDYQLSKLLDLGDQIGVSGHLFRTKTNELSIWASALQFLAKCFLPLPEKWHGLQDVEIRYRQRYLDLIVNPDVRRVFEIRTATVSAIRKFLEGARVPRSRDADDAADRRRRAGAAVRDASQRARHEALPAHRARALPEAAHRRRHRTGLRDQS